MLETGCEALRRYSKRCNNCSVLSGHALWTNRMLQSGRHMNGPDLSLTTLDMR